MFDLGPLFVDHQGRQVESGLHNGIIIEALEDRQVWETVHVKSNMQLLRGTGVANVCGSFASFKRGAITRALEATVSTTDVEFMGRGDHGRRPRGGVQGALCASTAQKLSSFWTLD